MSKFTFEIDTDTKTSKLTIDGQPYDFYEFACGTYIFSDPCCDTDVPNINKYTFLTHTVKDGETTQSLGISFSDDGKVSYDISTRYSIARKLGEVFAGVATASKIAKLFKKK